MNKNNPETIYKIYLFFPLTGILGGHKILTGNFGQFPLRPLSLGSLWIYDMFTVKKALRKYREKKKKKVQEIIDLIENGNAKKGWTKFITSGHGAYYAKLMVEMGRTDILIGSIDKDEESKKELEQQIARGDLEGFLLELMSALSKKYLGLKLF